MDFSSHSPGDTKNTGDLGSEDTGLSFGPGAETLQGAPAGVNALYVPQINGNLPITQTSSPALASERSFSSLCIPESSTAQSLGRTVENHAMGVRASAAALNHAARSEPVMAAYLSSIGATATRYLKALGPVGVIAGSVAEFIKDPSARGAVKAAVGLTVGFGSIAAIGALGLAGASVGTVALGGAAIALTGILVWKGAMHAVDRLLS